MTKSELLAAATPTMDDRLIAQYEHSCNWMDANPWTERDRNAIGHWDRENSLQHFDRIPELQDWEILEVGKNPDVRYPFRIQGINHNRPEGDMDRLFIWRVPDLATTGRYFFQPMAKEQVRALFPALAPSILYH